MEMTRVRVISSMSYDRIRDPVYREISTRAFREYWCFWKSTYKVEVEVLNVDDKESNSNCRNHSRKDLIKTFQCSL